MAKPTIALEDLNAEQRAAVRKATGRTRLAGRRTFTADLERRHALRILALLSELSQDQRRRVLRRASRINEV